MGTSSDTWIVFLVAFLASAITLAKLFISPEEFRALTQPGAERAKRKEAEEKKKAAEKAAAEKAAKDKAAKDKAAADKAAAEAAAKKKEEEEKEAEEAEGADEETARDTTVALMKFLEGSLTSLGDHKLDSFNRFGCHLFMAGASESIAYGAGLGQKQMFKLLAEAVSILGQGRATAQQFSDKYEEYLLEPKYVVMFKSGRDAMGPVSQGQRRRPRSVRRRKVRASKLIADGLWVDLRGGKYDPIRQLRVGTPDADHVSCLPAGPTLAFAAGLAGVGSPRTPGSSRQRCGRCTGLDGVLCALRGGRSTQRPLRAVDDGQGADLCLRDGHILLARGGEEAGGGCSVSDARGGQLPATSHGM